MKLGVWRVYIFKGFSDCWFFSLLFNVFWSSSSLFYDKRDDFNFPIVNFPFLSSNIPSVPAYGVYVSQLIRYARACSNYQDFMERGKMLTTKLLSQGYQKTKLVATLKKFYRRHYDLVNPYNVAVPRIVSDVFANDEQISRLPKSRTYASTDISFVQAYGHGGRNLLTK